jgi:hypothetical protein
MKQPGAMIFAYRKFLFFSRAADIKLRDPLTELGVRRDKICPVSPDLARSVRPPLGPWSREDLSSGAPRALSHPVAIRPHQSSWSGARGLVRGWIRAGDRMMRMAGGPAGHRSEGLV